MGSCLKLGPEGSTRMVSAPSDPPQQLNGRFRIEAELARGGMGTVYAAVDTSTDARVALKRLTPGASAQMCTLFEREFYVLSSLEHPRIIRVFDYGVDQDGPFYTMELLEGSDLRELAPLEVPLACRYLRDVASSLALLHARRLLHRDVSPRNVRTLPDGGCKLIDFGALTAFGTAEDVVGTPPAIPPEALSGQPLDQRADLYSLGALAYYLLTGQHAYPARRVSQLAQVWMERPPPPSALREGIPPELDQLVLALLSPEILGRPPNAADVIDRLTAIGGLPPDPDVRTAEAYLIGTVLVERQRELERVERRLARVKTGRGGAVFVDGVGKSRFLAEVALKAQLAGVTVLRADATRQSGSLGVIRALVQQLVRLAPRLAEKTIGPDANAVGAVWPEILEDLEVERPLPVGVTLDARAQAHALSALPSILQACFARLATMKTNAVLLAVDNVDRADAESAALLMALARGADETPLLLVTTAPANAATSFGAAIRALRDVSAAIRLRELTEEGVKALVQSAFGDVPHALRTGARLFAATDGNPEACVNLMQAWLRNGLVRYTAGAFSLPIELPARALPRAEHAVLHRFIAASPDARHLAQTLGVLGRPASLSLAIALETPERSGREVITALEELTETEILTVGPEGYRFRHEALRAAVLGATDEAELASLHARVGNVLLGMKQVEPEDRVAAGWHLIRGTEAGRGADLIASGARAALVTSGDPARALARRAPALEAALEVYRREGRSNTELLGLLVPLALASYEISAEFAARHGEETITRLERALGLPGSAAGAKGGAAPPLDAESLLRTLSAAPYDDSADTASTKDAPSPPDVVTLVGWLIRVVMSLTAVGSATIDHEGEARFAAALRPFTVLGPNHPASAAHEYCQLIITMTEDRLAESHRRWSDLLGRIDQLGFPPAILRRLRMGALYSLGVLESQRDDDTALARMSEIASSKSPQDAAIANQLRFLYHGFRGEIDLAEQSRARVEAYAMQYGSAWQIEIWSTCTLSAVYGNTRDTAGNKRVVEQLERLKETAPSLEQYWERAVAAQHLLTGTPARGIELCERTLSRSEPRERVGWSCVRGMLALGYNQIGKHDVAKRICEETRAVCREDREFVSMNLGVELELCLALAGLGEFETARAECDALLRHHESRMNPMTLGSLHRTGAQIAQQEGDSAAFERHFSEMERWFRSTNNPALIAQCAELRQLFSDANSGAALASEMRFSRAGIGDLATSGRSLAQSVLASCHGAQDRKDRALELVASHVGAREAWLFAGAGRDEKPELVSKLGAMDVPFDLFPQVCSLFEEGDEDAEETACLDTGAPLDAILPARETSLYRLLPLTVNRGAVRHLVGAVALPADHALRLVSQRFLDEVASQLYQAGDIASVRLVG